MLKKRIIFKLYFKDKSFYLSRNFKLQEVGDVNWIFKNLNFEDISNYIDELIILNVDKNNYLNPINKNFRSAIEKLMSKTFIPLTIGGGLRHINHAKECFKIGADKILLNSSIEKDRKFINQCVKKFGSQAILCGIDFKRENNEFYTYVSNGSKKFCKLKA